MGKDPTVSLRRHAKVHFQAAAETGVDLPVLGGHSAHERRRDLITRKERPHLARHNAVRAIGPHDIPGFIYGARRYNLHSVLLHRQVHDSLGLQKPGACLRGLVRQILVEFLPAHEHRQSAVFCNIGPVPSEPDARAEAFPFDDRRGKGKVQVREGPLGNRPAAGLDAGKDVLVQKERLQSLLRAEARAGGAAGTGANDNDVVHGFSPPKKISNRGKSG